MGVIHQNGPLAAYFFKEKVLKLRVLDVKGHVINQYLVLENKISNSSSRVGECIGPGEDYIQFSIEPIWHAAHLSEWRCV